MIDVCAAGRHATIVEDDRVALCGSALERSRNRLLAQAALEVGLLVLGRASHAQQQPADVRMSAANARFAAVPPAQILALRARPRLTAIERAPRRPRCAGSASHT